MCVCVWVYVQLWSISVVSTELFIRNRDWIRNVYSLNSRISTRCLCACICVCVCVCVCVCMNNIYPRQTRPKDLTLQSRWRPRIGRAASSFSFRNIKSRIDHHKSAVISAINHCLHRHPASIINAITTLCRRAHAGAPWLMSLNSIDCILKTMDGQAMAAVNTSDSHECY